MLTDVRAQRFAWGLSQGIAFLGSGGGFWLLFGLFKGTAAASSGSIITVASTIVGIGVLLILLGAARLKRLSGFSRADLQTGGERDETNRMTRQFGKIILLQCVACVAVFVLTLTFRRPDLTWPLIGIFLGLHFVPLAKIFVVPVYTFLGVGIVAVSVGALLCAEPVRDAVLGGGNGILMWLSAAYLLRTTTGMLRPAALVR